MFYFFPFIDLLIATKFIIISDSHGKMQDKMTTTQKKTHTRLCLADYVKDVNEITCVYKYNDDNWTFCVMDNQLQGIEIQNDEIMDLYWKTGGIERFIREEKRSFEHNYVTLSIWYTYIYNESTQNTLHKLSKKACIFQLIYSAAAAAAAAVSCFICC